ncbi:nucleolar protein,Nop52-domain-containing protein [Microdochium bolleyi]|uniref:Nucleolar protein,Nop52-domain-containing protein n=1 Tax=Microdochium bolleyi TaxID=196109 RepID=A0A136J3B0_9PEZI|nr:nucleolar protein,Nop52-domain-containing protein [Microdochium bolleyi]
MAADTQSMPFIKHLASSDRKIRTSALDTLRTFLSASASTARLTHTDNLKLWKGLYYSLWMCDRPVPQQNLCADLAGLLGTIAAAARRSGGGENAETEVVIGWLAAFWETLSREWTSIDVLRLEKFLLLVRRVFAASLVWAVSSPSSSSSSSSPNGSSKAAASKKSKKAAAAKKRRGSKSAADQQQDEEEEEEQQQQDAKTTTTDPETLTGRQSALIALLREWPLDQTGNLGKVSVGLRLHVLDIWVDEAEKAGVFTAAKGQDGGSGEESATTAPAASAFLTAIRELVEAQSQSPSKPVRARAKEGLADERLPWNETKPDDEDEEMGSDNDGGEDGWGGFDD